MTGQEFINQMRDRRAHLIEHAPEVCGNCAYRTIMADVADEIAHRGVTCDSVAEWSAEVRRRWESTKFFKLWQNETAAGRNPKEAFARLGWES